MKIEGLDRWGMSAFKNGPKNTGQFANDRAKSSLPPIFVAGFVFAMIFLLGAIALLVLKPQPAPVIPSPPIAISQPQTAPVAIPEMDDVIVPIKNVSVGQQLDRTILTVVSMPRSSVPFGALKAVEEVEGLYAKVNINANSPVTRASVSHDKPTNKLVSSIPQGFRAVSINVDATSGVEGWARAGAHVDVQWISEVNGALSIMPVVQNTKILSAERRIDPNADSNSPLPATVTLLVTDLDAQKITLTSTSGKLILHMRGTNDQEVATTVSPLSVEDLFLESQGGGEGSALHGMVKVKDRNGNVDEWMVIKNEVVKKEKS